MLEADAAGQDELADGAGMEDGEPVASGEPAASGEPGGSGLSMADVRATGEPRVDAALRRLGDLDDAPVSEHPPIFERIHGELVEVLGELHSGADLVPQGGQGQGQGQGPTIT